MTLIAPDIPWYFRPAPIFAAYAVASVIGLAALVFARAPGSDSFLLAGYILFLLFFLSWPYLLYEYLAPSASSASRHKTGRYNFLYILVFFSLGAVSLLISLDITLPESNDPTDLFVFPIILPYLIITWSAAHLLIEIESRAQNKEPASMLLTFLAIFYTIFGVGWIAVRLRRLKRAGRIL